ncbi:MAG: DNA topoisomerase IV subunit A [Nanoarchaeota archaeon]|nr:DNA topoisomerase IV subunit A [Nanoarchaeota archaeon]MBU1135414.1 DNA topoisomerase IV subunit A [Nanoarchaeota archaeon]MBU2520453.1 DNA topoisomerase IV subunit A [Nanoarchaeota archaeon]
MNEKEVIGKLSGLGNKVLKDIKSVKDPDIQLPVRALSNIYFDEKSKLIKLGDKTSHRSYMNIAHTRKFMQTLLVAAECKKIIDQNVSTSIRDLYYAVKHTIPGTKENTFEEQSESDPIIEDIEATLNTLREQLHLQADRKGYIAGSLVINDTGDEIDCGKMGSSGWAIPSNAEPDVIKFKKCDAEYVLMVEKDAVWQRLNQDKFWQKQNCLIITGKGQPARGTRRIVNRLHKELNLPIYVLTDADPWGYYIYSVLKQGSINLSFLSDRIGTPKAKFIGLTTMDVEKFGIPKNVTIRLTEGDKKRTVEMLNYVWFKPKEWQDELKNMMKVGYKLELEALSAKGIKYISEKYLPEKINNKEFLP